jgi:hypothetical protein
VANPGVSDKTSFAVNGYSINKNENTTECGGLNLPSVATENRQARKKCYKDAPSRLYENSLQTDDSQIISRYEKFFRSI